LRAVHLINHLGRGGSERQLFLTLSHLERQRWENHVVVFNPSSNAVFDQALQERGIHLWPLAADCRGTLRRTLFLSRLLRRVKAAVVHSWTVHDNPYAALAGLAAGVPVCWGSLRGSLDTPAVKGLSPPTRWLTFRGVQKVVANSEELAGQLRREGLASSRILVLPNCVELPEDSPAADLSALGIEPGQPLVGSIGNLRRIKNHQLLIEAMARVVEREPAARAVLVGQSLNSEPDYPAELEGEIRRRGLDHAVHLAGFRDDVGAVLQRLDILCLTSHSEGMPNAVLEAMAAGRPVVAVRVGGVPELIQHGVNGLIVPPGDAGALAEALLELLQDPERAAAMGREGRRLAERHHSCAAVAERLSSSYLRALERKGKRR
jgi:glycosyltransferase involved in cell wall biosynthesis